MTVGINMTDARVYRVICRERARHGSLHTFLRHNDVTQRRRRRCDVICRLLVDVARALDFIHSRHLVHGNVTSHAVYVVGPHTVICNEHTDTDRQTDRRKRTEA